MRQLLRILLLTIFASWVAGCGGGGSGNSSSAGGTISPPGLPAGTPSVVALELDPRFPTIPLGTSLQIHATALLSDGNRADVTSVAVWSSEDETRLAVNAGLARALASGGTVRISATFRGVSNHLIVTLSEAILQRISITPSPLTIPDGLTQSLTATGSFTDGIDRDVTQDVAWTSDSDAVASVTTQAGQKGRVTGNTPGTTKVRAQLSGVSAIIDVTVTQAVLLALELSPPSNSLPKGVLGQFVSTAIYSDASRVDVSEQSDWSSQDPGIAAVSNATNSRGRWLGTGLGQTVIQASFQTRSATATATVTASELIRLDVTPADSSLAKGLEQSMIASGTYTDGQILNLTNQVTWSSSNEVVAIVSNAVNQQGRVTAVSLGQAKIQANLGGIQGETFLTVDPPVVQRLEIFPKEAKKAQGATQAYSANATLSDASIRDATAEVTWSVVDPNTATITPAGKLTGRSLGITQVKAEMGGVTDFSDLVVPIERISQNNLGVGGDAGQVQGTGLASLSSDGRYVAFTSAASNLVDGDSNGLDDIFIRDRAQQTTIRVSLSSTAQQSDGSSRDPSLSWDGNHLAFRSQARNLVTGRILDLANLYVRNLVTGTTQLAYTLPNAGTSGDASSPSLSFDGQTLAFTAGASPLGSGGTNAWLTRQPTLVPTFLAGPGGARLDGSVLFTWLSADASKFMFVSTTSQAVSYPPPTRRHLFIFDRQSGQYDLVDRTTGGVEADSSVSEASLSSDGSVVAFMSGAENLGIGNSVSLQNAFVRDRAAGTTSQINNANQGLGYHPVVSANGRFISFGAGENGHFGVYVHDRTTGTNRACDLSDSGLLANQEGRFPTISPDGRVIVFQTSATNLFAKDNPGVFDSVAVLNPFLIP